MNEQKEVINYKTCIPLREALFRKSRDGGARIILEPHKQDAAAEA